MSAFGIQDSVQVVYTVVEGVRATDVYRDASCSSVYTVRTLRRCRGLSCISPHMHTYAQMKLFSIFDGWRRRPAPRRRRNGTGLSASPGQCCGIVLATESLASGFGSTDLRLAARDQEISDLRSFGIVHIVEKATAQLANNIVPRVGLGPQPLVHVTRPVQTLGQLTGRWVASNSPPPVTTRSVLISCQFVFLLSIDPLKNVTNPRVPVHQRG